MRARSATSALLFAACLCATPDSPAKAAGPGLWSAGGTTLRTTPTGYLAATAGRELPLTLPAGAEVEELFALRQGAFLSGRSASARSVPGEAPRSDLFLALLDARGLHALPSPATDAEGGQQRENAVPLAALTGELAGLAWLEGHDRQSYAVRYAAWDGMRWSEPAVVAAAAPGSQLALAGATLADGTKLLVWTRFDGRDDEIVAARFADGRWSAARPLAPGNDVPDVTPALVAVPGGALAAWSRYDGHDYRVVVARFDGREWSAPTWAGPVGSTYPALQRAEVGDPGAAPAAARSGEAAAWLTYAHAASRGWAVVELAASGRTLRRAEVSDAPAARPALAVQPSGAIRLRWVTTESEVELE